MHTPLITSLALGTLFFVHLAHAHTPDHTAQEPLLQQQPPAPHHANDEHTPGADNPLDLTQSAFMGLMTYANLPYIHCLANEDVHESYRGEKYDIAVYVWRLCLRLLASVSADFVLGLERLLIL